MLSNKLTDFRDERRFSRTSLAKDCKRLAAVVLDICLNPTLYLFSAGEISRAFQGKGGMVCDFLVLRVDLLEGGDFLGDNSGQLGVDVIAQPVQMRNGDAGSGPSTVAVLMDISRHVVP